VSEDCRYRQSSQSRPDCRAHRTIGLRLGPPRPVGAHQDHDITLNSSTTSYLVSSAQVLTGDAKDSYNDFGQPEAVTAQPLAASNYQACGRSLSLTLPAKSVVMLRLDPQQ
jgi:alpha-L-arabinofuranosidase